MLIFYLPIQWHRIQPGRKQIKICSKKNKRGTPASDSQKCHKRLEDSICCDYFPRSSHMGVIREWDHIFYYEVDRLTYIITPVCNSWALFSLAGLQRLILQQLSSLCHQSCTWELSLLSKIWNRWRYKTRNSLTCLITAWPANHRSVQCKQEIQSEIAQQTLSDIMRRHSEP